MEDRWQESFELGSPRSGPRYSTSLRGSLFAHDVSWEPPSASIPRCADARCHNHLLRCPSFRQHEGRSHPVWQIRANHWRDVARQRSRTLLHGLRGRIQPARISATRAVEEGLPRRPCFWLAAFSEGTKCPGPRNTDDTPLIVFGLLSQSTLPMTGRCWWKSRQRGCV